MSRIAQIKRHCEICGDEFETFTDKLKVCVECYVKSKKEVDK